MNILLVYVIFMFKKFIYSKTLVKQNFYKTETLVTQIIYLVRIQMYIMNVNPVKFKNSIKMEKLDGPKRFCFSENLLYIYIYH